MKILFVHDNPTHHGGAETYLFSLMDFLEKRGHQTFLFSFDEGENLKTADSFIYGEKKKSWFRRHISYYYFDLGVYNAMKSYIKEIKPDIIHLHNITKYPSTIMLAAGNSRVPVVQTIHDIRVLCPTGLCIKPKGNLCDGGFGLKCAKNGCILYRSYVYNILPNMIKKHLIKRKIKTIICASQAFEKKLQENGINNVTYLPHYIDSKKYDSDSAKIEDGFILFAGMLEKSKGINFLIEAFPKVVERFDYSRLHILGEGREKEGLISLAEELGVKDKIIFHGKVQIEEMPRYYSKANVVVFPSACFELFGFVILEAMAAGRPVVGSRVGGVPELIRDGVNGFTVEPRNPELITERVIRLLSDRKLVEEMGRRGRKIVEGEFRPEDHITKLLQLYNSLKR